jgi:hypothetical protein
MDQTPRVILRGEIWKELQQDAGLAPLDTYFNPDHGDLSTTPHGEDWHPALVCDASAFARFILATTDKLGRYDSAMMCAIACAALSHNGFVYYFPGLELL